MREVSDRCIEVSHAYDVILGVINSSICQVKKRQSCDFWKKAQTLIKMRPMYCNSINCDLRFFLRGTCKKNRLSSIKSVSHTQVILIQLNFLHERRHHKGESLSVEVVERVADKHGQKYCAPVVSITCCGHGCRFSPFRKWQQKNKPCSCRLRLLLPVTATFASGSTVHRQLLTCGEVFAISRGG